MKSVVNALMLVACTVNSASPPDEPVIGGPCEGCESVFIGIPKVINSSSRIAPVGEKGEPLVLEGTVRKRDGAPAEGIIVYAYHTNSSGVYPSGTTRHGRYRGWARTDSNGQFRFDTIRPGAYPSREIPQHIHMHIIEPGKATYYIDDIIFDDDPLLTAKHRQQMRLGRGGYGESHPVKDAQGKWVVRRDITLGENIPGYIENDIQALRQDQPNRSKHADGAATRPRR